ncbi:MAG: hypothetical protein ACOYB4_01075 [Methyloceanibacter sp.]
MLKRILIGSGILLALLLALLFLAGYWGDSGVSPRQTVEMSYGNRLVTIKGYYKDLRQELTADELLVTVDGHQIAVNNSQVLLDGALQVVEPDQNVEIAVAQDGTVVVSMAAEAGDTGAEAEPE